MKLEEASELLAAEEVALRGTIDRRSSEAERQLAELGAELEGLRHVIDDLLRDLDPTETDLAARDSRRELRHRLESVDHRVRALGSAVENLAAWNLTDGLRALVIDLRHSH